MTKPESMDQSYSDVGRDLRFAKVYANGGQQLTKSKSGEITAWFGKRKNQKRRGITDWLIEFYKNAGATVILVDYYSDGVNPYQITWMVKGSPLVIEPINSEKLQKLMINRGVIDPRVQD